MSVRLQRVVDLGAHAQRLGERRRAARDDHELLEVDVVVGVHAAVEHVHHRHRQHVRRRAAEVAVQRQPLARRPAAWAAASETPRIALAPSRDLLGVPSSAISASSSAALVGRVEAAQRLGDLAVHVRDGLRDALAAVALAAVAQLDRLELAGRRARGHGGAADGARVELDLDLDGGVAARVEDLAGVDVSRSGSSLSRGSWRWETTRIRRSTAGRVDVVAGEVHDVGVTLWEHSLQRQPQSMRSPGAPTSRSPGPLATAWPRRWTGAALGAL